MAMRSAGTGVALAAVQLVIAIGCTSPEKPREEATPPAHLDSAEERPWQGTVNALVDQMGCILVGTVEGECSGPAVIASAFPIKYDLDKVEDPDRIEVKVVCLEGLQVILGSPSLHHVDLGMRADRLPSSSRLLVFAFETTEQPAADEHAGDCGGEDWGTAKRTMILADSAIPIDGSNCIFSEPAMAVPLDQVVKTIESRVHATLPQMVVEEFQPFGLPSTPHWNIRISPDGSYEGTTSGRLGQMNLDYVWSLADSALQAAQWSKSDSFVGWSFEQHGPMYRIVVRRQSGVQLLFVGPDPPPSTASDAEVSAAKAALTLWCALPVEGRPTWGCDWIHDRR